MGLFVYYGTMEVNKMTVSRFIEYGWKNGKFSIAIINETFKLKNIKTSTNINNVAFNIFLFFVCLQFSNFSIIN